MRSEKDITNLIKEFKVTPPAEQKHAVLAEALRLQQSRGSVSTGSYIMNHKLTSIAAVLVIIIGVFFALNRGGVPIDGASIAWADVVKQFRAVRSLEVVAYIKQDAVSAPEQLELWFSGDGKIRMRSDSKVIFSDNGKITGAYDVTTRKAAEPDDREKAIMVMLNIPEFSLNSIVGLLMQGRLENVTPEVNQDETISEDVMVFDIVCDTDRQWTRIWTLRESRLPYRMKMYDPQSGKTTDAIFTYTKPQPDNFFNADEFGKLLESGNLTKTVVYYGIRDPLEKEISPNVGNDHEVLNITTTTLDGQSWSVAQNLKDKNIALYFWDMDSRVVGFEHLRQSGVSRYMDLLNDRTDFIFANVILAPDAKTVKDFVEKYNIPGLCLHEPGKGYSNSLASILGVNESDTFITIDQDGFVTTGGEYHLKPMIEYIDNGLTYESLYYPYGKITMAYWKNKSILTKEYVERIMKGKGEVSASEIGEDWEYFLVNKKGTSADSKIISFDNNGQCVNLGGLGRSPESEFFHCKISQACWDRQIKPIISSYLPLDNTKREIWLHNVTNPEDNVPLFFNKNNIQPEKIYGSVVSVGLYDVYLHVKDSNWKEVVNIKLLENITVEKGKKHKLVIDDIPVQTKQP